ncbi:hypothetical protein KSP39_PZI016286 [Platanthera zijinensis]|uniref:Uncharacterized protein n=1 Tax=Platanthera zijinensis TaxID=2320716 RepID=A0AAP0G0S5_9ASPA
MLQGYIGYFNPGNQASCSRQEPVQPVNDPGQSSSLPPQLRPQYPYHHSYGLNLLGRRKCEPGRKVNLQEGRVGLQAHCLEPPRPGFDARSQTWASTSASCGVTMFDAQPCIQVSRYDRILKLVVVQGLVWAVVSVWAHMWWNADTARRLFDGAAVDPHPTGKPRKGVDFTWVFITATCLRLCGRVDPRPLDIHHRRCLS